MVKKALSVLLWHNYQEERMDTKNSSNSPRYKETQKAEILLQDL